MIRGKVRPPVHIHVVLGIHSAVGRTGDHDQFLLEHVHAKLVLDSTCRHRHRCPWNTVEAIRARLYIEKQGVSSAVAASASRGHGRGVLRAID
jgi:hypothetical protein